MNKKFIYFLDIVIAMICLNGIYHSSEKAGLNATLGYWNDRLVVVSGDMPLQINDRILAVQGFQVSTPEEVEFLLDRYSIGGKVSLTIARNGEKIVVGGTLQAINSIFYLISLFIAGALFFGLGVFVLKSRPDKDTVAVVFHWISITVCIHITTTFGRYLIPPLYIGHLLRAVFFLASALTPVLFVHLSYLFPRKKWSGYQQLIKGLYTLALFFFAVITTLFLMSSAAPSLKQFNFFMIAYNVGRLFFAGCMILGVANFVHSYFTAPEEAERRKLRWVILGLGIGPLGFIFLWQLPQAISSVALVPEEVILLISVFTPLMFAISIVRYHILDIDFIFNRSTVYFIVLTMIVVIYAAVIAVAAFFLGTMTVQASLMISAVAAVIIALLFEPARIRVQQFVDKQFFRIRYNYRLAQIEFTQEINQSFQISTISKFIVKRLDQLLRADCTGLFLLNKLGFLELSAGKDVANFDEDIKEELLQFGDRSLSPLRAVARFIEDGISYESANVENFKKNRIALVMPLRVQHAGISGFLALGPKKSGLPFTFEDIDLLKTVCAETSFAIERIHMQEELLLQYAETERLSELNQLKSYFVSSVSHDLQTPLTSIKMFAEILQSKKKISDEDKAEYLEIIRGETERLSTLINNVLDYSRIERGEMKFRFEQVDLVSLIESVLRTMKYQLEQSGFSVEKDYPESIIIRGDRGALTAVLLNLITNSIKYSADKKLINISGSVENNQAIISIKDHGIGISKEEQTKIFNTFYRSSEKRVQSLGGAGLGLTLVRHVIKAHKGLVQVNSKAGEGASFILQLPMGEKS